MARISKKRMEKELMRCGKNPLYFIKNYCQISHPIEGIIPFDTYDFQDELVEDYEDYKFNIILKARQLGISTVTAAYACWMMLFRRNKNIVIVATKRDTAKNLLKKVRKMYSMLPDFIRISAPEDDNAYTFSLKNGSQVKAESTSGDVGRSEAISLLIIDEAAHVEGLTGDDGIWTSLYPTLSTGGQCIAISTPNGVGGWFYEKVMGAKAGENDFKLTELKWDVHPDRDEAWFQEQTRNFSRRKIAQEYLINFNASGETVIHPDDLKKIREYLEEENELTGIPHSEPKYKVYHDRNKWIWKQPVDGHSYLIAADVARGDGRDYSTFHVLDINTDEIVCEYKGKLTYDEFAYLLVDTAREYFSPLVTVEANNLGIAVINEMKNRNYTKIYHSKNGEYVDPVDALNENAVKEGFVNSKKSRPQIVAKMEEYLRNDIITVNSPRLYHELTTFVWNNGKPEAQTGSNDDLVMAFAILCWVRETAIKENVRDRQYAEAFLSTISKKSRKLDTSMNASRNMPGGPYLQRKSKKQEDIELRKKYSWIIKN